MASHSIKTSTSIVFVTLSIGIIGIACGPPPPPSSGIDAHSANLNKPAGIDRAAAADALEELQEDASRCGVKGFPAGEGKAVVTFDNVTGALSDVKIDEAPIAGTPVALCVDRVFKTAKVSPFAGGPVKVNVRFYVAAPDSSPGFSVRTAKAAVRDAFTHCSLKPRGREVGADEAVAKFKKDGTLTEIGFFKFEDHGPLDDSDATRCVKKEVKSAHVPPFSSDEERAQVRIYFSR